MFIVKSVTHTDQGTQTQLENPDVKGSKVMVLSPGLQDDGMKVGDQYTVTFIPVPKS